MGVNLVIYVHRDDLKKLLELEDSVMIWDDFLFLVDESHQRWYNFEEKMKLHESELIAERKITSRELLIHIASLNKKIPMRRTWARILERYNLLFAPDTEEVDETEWISIKDIFYAIQELVKRRFKEVLEIYALGDEDE